MIPKGLFTQIGMVILAVALIVTYVRPTFTEISEVQDSINVYKEEKKKVVTVNSQLANLTSRLETISNEDKRQLFNYMPDSIDTVSVPRDLAIISEEAGVLYKNALDQGATDKVSNDLASGVNTPPIKHEFSLTVEGTYGQIKKLFTLMEQNQYPLEVQSVSIDQIDGGFLSASINIATYSYREHVTSKKITF